MFFHLVQADCELPNDNPMLRDPCGILALLLEVQEDLRADGGDEPAIEVAGPRESGILPLSAREDALVREAEEAPAADRDDVAVDDDGGDIEVVDELPPVEFEVVASSPAVSPDDPFALFVRTLVDVAQDAGCARAAALLPALLDEGQVDASVLGETTLDGLVKAGVLDRGPSGLVGGEGFRRTAQAWRAILRGDSDDFAACGPRMLDEWAADLVARILAAPARTEQLRRELRTRGVAAFGLVLAA